MVDAEVREKCNTLFRQWASHYGSTPGLSSIATLYKELPKRAKPAAAHSKVLRETERQALEDPFHVDEDDEQEEAASPPKPSPAQASLQQHGRRKSSLGGMGAGGASPASSSRRPTLVDQIPSSSHSHSIFASSKDKDKSKKKSKSKRRVFNLQQETPQIMKAIASSNIASTNLLNSLKFLNREAGELPSTNREVSGRFETCKVLRREVLRYIQLVESEQWIGSLLQANDELVRALMAWEVLEK